MQRPKVRTIYHKTTNSAEPLIWVFYTHLMSFSRQNPLNVVKLNGFIQ